MNKYIFREKGNLILHIALTAIASVFLALTIVFTKNLFISDNTKICVIVLALSMVLFVGLNYLKNRVIYNMGLIFVEQFKRDLFHSVISKNFFEIKGSSKDFSNQISSTSVYLKEYYIIPTLQLISDLTMLVVCFFTIGYTVSFVPVIVLSIAVFVFGVINSKIDKSIIEKKTDTSKLRERYVYFLDDFLNSKKVINSKVNSSLEQVHARLIDDISEKVSQLDKEELIKSSLQILFMSICCLGMTMFVFENKSITSGEIIVLLMSLSIFYHFISKIVRQFYLISQSQSKISELEENFMDQESPKKLVDKLDSVEFRDVKLYSPNLKLKVNYTFNSDEKYLIVCENDEVINLLAKAFNQSETPQSGAIMVNSMPIEEFDISNNLLVTYDESCIFDTDFANNVTLFHSFPDQKIIALSKMYDDELVEKQRYREYSQKDKSLIRYKRMINQNANMNVVVNLFDNLDDITGNILLQDSLVRFKGLIYCSKKTNDEMKSKFDKILKVENIDDDYLLVEE